MPIVRYLLIPLALGLMACASQAPKPPKTTDFFTTLIQTDGTKQFSYSLVMELPDSAKQGDGRGMGGKKRGGRGGQGGHSRGKKGGDKKQHEGDGMDNLDQLTRLTEEGLLVKWEDTGYCRNSYRTLETESRRGAMNITGECYDKATADDRDQFPNPAPKQIIEQRLD